MMYVCQYCVRLMKYPVAHKCRDGFRKRKLKFKTIMTKEETAERIKVMQAYVDGKQIQCFDIIKAEWEDIDTPNWNNECDYRIKPERKYRPFKDADEAFQEAKKHGFWCKIGVDYSQIVDITNTEILFTIDTYYGKKGNLFGECLNFVWADDGTPCGILEE